MHNRSGTSTSKHENVFRRKLAGCAATLAVLVGTVVATTPTSAAAAPAAQGTETHWVSLVTGDRVLLTGNSGVTVAPAPGREGVVFRTTAKNGRITVLPSDAAKLIAAGRLDPMLFDVTELVRQRVDDASRPDLPLIISSTDVGGARITRELTSIGGAAVSVAKNDLAAWWAGQRASAASAGKIWLDRKRRLVDDESNPQIGVPAAWQAGYTGKDVKVAVLDTGVDATHPDLAGVVAEDFTGSADGTKDTVGHGTHVASIVAGSGAASNGKYRGVAPDAKLLAGKVCDDEECEESAILEGLEWAVAQQARIVSLSIGGPDYPGVDLLEQAVNELTASSGTLFVIAAGNLGSRAETINSPGSADAALTVASVSKSDVLSTFSSRGPRVGDGALKPDIAAPGVNIVAARAAGTDPETPVGEHYASLTGTSMATPHVTGAAAILAQQHPDWRADQLKAALGSTAHPVAGADVFAQGAGRVDIGRGVTQAVFGTPSVSFGVQQGDPPPSTKTATYTNTGSAPVTLDLALTTSAPAGAFAIGATKVTVPAGGQAGVQVTLTPAALADAPFGGHSARLTATSGDTVVRTAVGTVTKIPTYRVRAKFIDRDGNPASDEFHTRLLSVQQDDSGAETDSVYSVGGTAEFELAKGTYALFAEISTPAPGRPTVFGSETVALEPEVVADHDGIEVVFDARKGKPLKAVVDQPGAIAGQAGVLASFATSQGKWTTADLVFGANQMYAVPATADPAKFQFGFQTSLVSPPNAKRPFTYDLAFGSPGKIPTDPTFRVRDRNLGTVNAPYRSLGTKPQILERGQLPRYLPDQELAVGVFLPVKLPERRVERYTAAPTTWSDYMVRHAPGEPIGGSGQQNGFDHTFAAGRTIDRGWNTPIAGPRLSTDPLQLIPTYLRREGDTVAVRLSAFSPNDAVVSSIFDAFDAVGSTTLSRDGKVVGRSALTGLGTFTVPADEGVYTVVAEGARKPSWTALTSAVNATWTFRSTRTAAATLLPVITADVSGPFDDHSRAAAGKPFTLDLTVRTQPGAVKSKITDVTVEYSDDDGKTWRTARDRHCGGDRWQATVDHPPLAHGTGFVSLRVSAKDAAGGSMQYTITRAYELK